MEGDAKGQVGGMEMPESERKRLANESKTWKCQGCGGRRNEDILREEGGEGEHKEQVIPEGLRFGFKDEMGKAAAQEESQENSQQIQPSSIPATTAVASVTPSTTPQNTPASSSSTSPQPTRTTIASSTVAIPQNVANSIHQGQSDGVPAWIDKAITGFAAALALMIIKKVLL